MIEAGEYIRTDKDSEILKIIEVRKENKCITDKYSNLILQLNRDFIKHSKNIIDLIEVGDIVNYTFWEEPDDFTVFCEMIIDVQQLQQFKLEIKEECITLNSILTYEQYEQNCYKVGDIE